MKRLHVVLIVSIVIMQFALPYVVLADETTPPPDTTEETQPADSDAGEDAPAPQNDFSLDMLPDDVHIVVTDSDNQPLPLATQAAAEAIATSDPAWCPDGASLSAGECVNYPDFTTLIAGLNSLPSLTSGTVYIEAGAYDGSEAAIVLDGAHLSNVGNLTLIGGWDLSGTPPTQIGRTTFFVPFSVINWAGAVSIRDINLQSVTGTGITVEADGPVEVANVDVLASWNDTFTANGINVQSSSDVILDNVLSSSNVNGIVVETSGNVTLNNVISENNYKNGIQITTGADVALNNVKSQFNYGDGIRIDTQANVILNDVSTSYNLGEGIYITPGATVIANNVQSTNDKNTAGIGLGMGGSEERDILGGESINLQTMCAEKSVVIFKLPSGDSALVFCPIGGTLSINNIGKKKLPASLPEGYAFVSGLETKLTQDGAPVQVITDAGHLKVSFVIPPEQAGKNLVILFWDASTNQWVELPILGSESSITLPNGAKVLEGAQVLNETGLIEVSVNFPGIFALAVK